MSTNINITEDVINIIVTEETINIEVSGGQGPVGPTGQGVPSGGTAGQLLAKNSSTNYDTSWVTYDNINWDIAYNRSLISATVTGTTTKVLTLNEQSGNTITASWSDISGTGTVTSISTTSPLTGGIITTSGTLGINKSSAIQDGYLSSADWVLFNNKQNELGYIPVPNTRQLTINGITYDLSTDRSWNIASMIYPSAGIAVSTGTSWATSIIDNSSNWNLAYLSRISSLTTNGNSGSATLTQNVLNIPTYTLSGLGGISLNSLSSISPLLYNNSTGVFSIQQADSLKDGYLSSADWLTFNSKQSALTFTAPLINTAGTITITQATTSTNGYLSSNDWNTFNNKQNKTIVFNNQSGSVYANLTNGIVVYEFTSNGELILPNAINNNAIYIIKNRYTSNITVSFTGGQNADGSTSVILIPNQALQFISNNSNYNIF